MEQYKNTNLFVTKDGRVWSSIKNKWLNKNKSGKGYYMIQNNLVHRLVAKTYIPNPENKPQVNHKNGIKTDNRVENLEWATAKENVIHGFATGLSNTILSKEQVLEIRQLYPTKKYNQLQLARMFYVSPTTISDIVNNRSWQRLLLPGDNVVGIGWKKILQSQIK